MRTDLVGVLEARRAATARRGQHPRPDAESNLAIRKIETRLLVVYQHLVHMCQWPPTAWHQERPGALICLRPSHRQHQCPNSVTGIHRRLYLLFLNYCQNQLGRRRPTPRSRSRQKDRQLHHCHRLRTILRTDPAARALPPRCPFH